MPIDLPPKQITVSQNLQICETCLNYSDKKCVIIIDPLELREDGNIQGNQYQREFQVSDLLAADGGSSQLPWLAGVLASHLPKGAVLHHVSFQTPRTGLGACNMVFTLDGHSHETNIPIASLLELDGAREFYAWLKDTLYTMLKATL